MATTPTTILLLRQCSEFSDAIDVDSNYNIETFPEHNAALYWKQPPFNTPKWVRNILPSDSDLQDRLNTRSLAAVLLVKHAGRMFALTFGHARGMLHQENIEPHFGLKVVLNLVKPDSLRSIDTKSLDGSFTHTREQTPTLGPMSNFGFDTDGDFIRAVTGTSSDVSLGTTISGSESFHACTDVDLASLTELLDKILTGYNSTYYRSNFEFVDNIFEVPPALSTDLNNELIQNIISDRHDRIWLAPPEIVDWERHGGFALNRKRSRKVFDDIGLNDYIRENIGDIDQLTLQNLKNHKLIQLAEDPRYDINSWQIFKCLYAEIADGSKRYILTDGKWYEVDQRYVSRVEDYIRLNLTEWTGHTFPEYDAGQMLLPDANSLKGEAQYNAIVASAHDYSLMDRALIVHGGAGSRIEICDLYKPDLFIHVKRYTKSSGLSHLFNQGRVSAELLHSDVEFRAKAATKITDISGTSPSLSFGTSLTRAHIVYGVISESRSANLHLPFFSQVSLKGSLQFLKNTLRVRAVSLIKIQSR